MTTMADVRVPELDRLTRELEMAEQHDREVSAEVSRLEEELPATRDVLNRVRAELGERMRAGTPAKELRSLKADESQAALQVETTEAFLVGRRQSLQEARRAVEKAKDRLRSGNQGAQALRIQLRVQQERVDRGRRKIAEDEASITHRRRLLAGEESTLAAIHEELGRLTGDAS